MPYVLIIAVTSTVILFGTGTLASWVESATRPAILVIFGAALMGLGAVLRRRARGRAVATTEPWSAGTPKSSPTAV